jgi:phytanoyl-CoA hydroxylase
MQTGIDGERYVLSPSQIEAYHSQGYLVVPGFLTEAELEPLEKAYERFKRGTVDGMGRDLCDMSGPYSRAFEDFNIINCVLPRVYDPSLQRNLFEQRAQSVAGQLIGADATLDYDQHLSKKPGRKGAVFAWHQDLGYWPTGTPDTRTTTCSLALDDATLENGCLQVVPGSHLEQEIRAHKPILTSDEGLRERTHTLSIELGPEDKLVPLPLKRGDITVHNERIVHGSGGNPTDRWRRTYIIAHRSRATVAYERSIGFTHSHNDTVQWQTHLEALSE